MDADLSDIPLQQSGWLRASPPLSNNVRVWKHKVEVDKSGERRGDPSRCNVLRASYYDKG